MYGVTALLESPPEDFLSNTSDPHNPAAINEEENHWKDNFHGAYEALNGYVERLERSMTHHQSLSLKHQSMNNRKSTSGRKLLETGIKMAIEMQQDIVKLGLSIIERQLIIRVKHFRYASLRLAEDEERFFTQPQTLSKVALFLVDLHREGQRWVGRNAAPFILISRSEHKKTFMVVGVTCPQRSGEVHRNTLGTAFKLAAEETGACYRHDGFETSVLEIQANDIQNFVEQLHNVMDA